MVLFHSCVVLILSSIALLHGVCGTAGISGSATVGIFFQHQIDVSNFNVSNSFSASVSFVASAYGHPDLPTWLRLEQQEPSDPAILYGTPHADSPDVVELEITGWDKTTYGTKRKIMAINVDHSEGAPRYQVELLVTNRNLDEFLQKNETFQFVENVKKVWQPTDGPQVTLVESALNRGGRNPLPIPGLKEKVYVAVGGSSRYRVFEGAVKPNCVKEPSKQFPSFNIDWKCGASRLIDMKKTSGINGASADKTAEGFTESAYVFNDYDPSGRDFGVLFILILILPLVIVLLITIILACIMFGHREGRQHRDTGTPRSQLHHHNSILRATFQLRQLSHQNTEPAARSAPTGTSLEQSQPQQTSTPYSRDTHQRPHDDEPDSSLGAPPPYQLPPAAGVNISSPDGSNRYYPSKDQGRHQRPPPFMNSSDLQ